MKNKLIPLIFIFLSLPFFAQNIAINALTIPDSLQENANAVFRYYDTNIEMSSFKKMTVSKKVAVTVLNKEGNNHGHVYLYYDKHTKINGYSAKIYDAFGNVMEKIRSGDLKDESAADGISLYNDNRVKYFEYIPKSYPYTIAYEYEYTTSNTAFIPRWLPIDYYYASTVKNTYTIVFPNDIKVRFKEVNLDHYTISKNISDRRISYQIESAKAIESESYSPSFLTFAPHVKFAANKFHLAGVDGEANNWKEFGKWMYDKLLVDRGELPEATKKEIEHLVSGINDPIKKAKLVYEYMQNKTRYISIQIGIGGWKPMLASEVEELGYGDCKALTNYTHALLKAANVPSYYSIIYAKRRRDIDNELASIQGNHAILMVPTAKDTIWLECTSQKVPFGYLGSFTDDRDALVVTPEGGKIMHTTNYKSEESIQNIIGVYTLNADGSISAKAKIESKGIQYNDNYRVAYYDAKEKDKYYKEFFDRINNLKIGKITHFNDEENILFTEDIEFTADNYASKSGERLLFRLNAFNVNDNIPERDRDRHLPLEITYGFIDNDEVIIQLPDGYTIEAIAKNQELKNKFGIYKISTEKIDDKHLKYKRLFQLNQGIYAISDYNEYRKFLKKINQLDNSKIVLIKNSLHEN